VHKFPSEEEECQKFPRRFNIDLQPKFVYSIGEVVDWTINCGVSLYLEFKPLEAGVVWDSSGIRRVPCNKSEIFADEVLTVAEKRHLMKFIEFCSKLIEAGSFDTEVKFKTVMDEKRLPVNLQRILMYSVLLIENEDVSLAEALSQMEKYVSSLGVYKDNCALLYPMYGSSDIPQGFCRMSAVYEGTYVITEDLQVMNIAQENDEFRVMTTFGEMKGKSLYLNPCFAKLDPELETKVLNVTFRAVVLCRDVLKVAEGPVLISVPPGEFGNPDVIYVLQLTESTSTVPAGYSMLHFWGKNCRVEYIERLIQSVPVEVVFFASYEHFEVICSGRFNHVSNPGGIEILKHFVRFI
jgi:Rab GDP dissociation inhibitor